MEIKCPQCKTVVASGPNEKGVREAAARHQAKKHPVKK